MRGPAAAGTDSRKPRAILHNEVYVADFNRLGDQRSSAQTRIPNGRGITLKRMSTVASRRHLRRKTHCEERGWKTPELRCDSEVPLTGTSKTANLAQLTVGGQRWVR